MEPPKALLVPPLPKADVAAGVVVMFPNPLVGVEVDANALAGGATDEDPPESDVP